MTDFLPDNSDSAVMMRNLLGAPVSSNLTPVRKIRILCWYGFLARHAGTNKAGSLERHFEPGAISIGSDGCTEQRKNKWRNYRDGRHKPQLKLVRDVDRLAPGSARILEHPVWQVCDPDNQSVALDPGFITQLSPKVQKIIAPEAGHNPYYQSGIDLSRQHHRALRKIPSLDALAAVTWLIRSSSGLLTKGPSQAFYAAHDILMTITTELHELGIAWEFLDHYIKWILPLALPKTMKIDLAPSDYLLISNFISHYMKALIHSRGEAASKEKIVKEISLAQDLKKDFDLCFALSPRFVPADNFHKNHCDYDFDFHNQSRHKALVRLMDPSLVGFLTRSESGSPLT
jgi:hypothetical protein